MALLRPLAASRLLLTYGLPRTSCQRFLSTAQVQLASLLYTKDHEWVRLEGAGSGVGVVGISQYAQESLGDVVYAQLPEVDEKIDRGSECGALESVKAASEIVAPLTGVVVEKNEAVEKAPALVNETFISCSSMLS